MRKHILRQRVWLLTHTQNSFIHNYRTKIPQDTCRIKRWNDPWYYVFLLSPGSSERYTKQELAPPSWLPHQANPACKPILSSSFPLYGVLRKCIWPLLAVIPPSIPHYSLKVLSPFLLYNLSLTRPSLRPMFAASHPQPHLPQTAHSSTQHIHPTCLRGKLNFLLMNPSHVGSDVSCTQKPPFYRGSRAHTKQWGRVRPGLSHASWPQWWHRTDLSYTFHCKPRAGIALPYALGSSQR